MNFQSSDTLRSQSTYSSSSKTDNSIRSGASSKKEEEDFTKDNVASPVDLDCLIQTERITKILDEAIYKIKLAICLPQLIQQGTLKSLLPQYHYDDVVLIFEESNSQLPSTDLLNISVKESIKSGDLSVKDRLSPEHGYLIYVLNSYPALRPVVKEMIDQMKEFYTSNKTEFPEPALEFLLTFEHFRDLMIVQLESTGSEYFERKLKMRKFENSNAKLIKEIEDYRAALKEESTRLEDTMAKKADIMAQLESKLASLNNDASMKIKQKILDSDRQMVLASRSHAVKYEILKEEEEQTRQLYNSTLKSNLADEKKLRQRRFRVETQLKSWIDKYDLEIANRQEELDEMTEKYKTELRKKEALEEQLAEQDKIFIPLMAEKEKEYHQEMEAKMKKFMHEHAARVIQTAWKAVVSNRAEKKKLTKLIKKKQKEAEKATKISLAPTRKKEVRDVVEQKKNKKKKKK